MDEFSNHANSISRLVQTSFQDMRKIHGEKVLENDTGENPVILTSAAAGRTSRPCKLFRVLGDNIVFGHDKQAHIFPKENDIISSRET